MCRRRQGFPEDHLGQLFNVSASLVSRIFITWVNFMFFKFGQINIWPSRKVIDTMLESSRGRYKSTRVITDCTEVRCQMPRSLQLDWELFSAYKNHTTLKGFVSISPSGAVTFRSQLYTVSGIFRLLLTQEIFPIIFTLNRPTDSNHFTIFLMSQHRGKLQSLDHMSTRTWFWNPKLTPRDYSLSLGNWNKRNKVQFHSVTVTQSISQQQVLSPIGKVSDGVDS